MTHAKGCPCIDCLAEKEARNEALISAGACRINGVRGREALDRMIEAATPYVGEKRGREIALEIEVRMKGRT